MHKATKVLYFLFLSISLCVQGGVAADSPDSLNEPLEFESPELKSPILSSIGKPGSEVPFRYRVMGCVANESYFDSRQDVGVIQGDLLLYPAGPLLDHCNRDINKKGHFNMIAIRSNFRCEIAGPPVFGANSFGVLDFDAWTEGLNLVVGRLRICHAFMYFEHRDKTLLMGQYWHPVMVTKCMPDVVSFNLGNPFEFYAREAQIRITKKFGLMTMLLAVCSRGSSIFDGPAALPVEVAGAYIRNGIMPNSHVQVHVNVHDHLFGLALDVTRAVPRLATQDDKLRVSESLMSYILFGFASLNWSPLTVNLKAIYAQNGFGYGLISGYAVHCEDKYSKERTYTNTQCLSVWADIFYRHPVIEPGLFIGYTKNLGACRSVLLNPNEETIFSGGQDNIDYVLRFSPRIRWLQKPFILGLELELTRAAFGTVTNTGRVKDAVPVNNVRALFVTNYLF